MATQTVLPHSSTSATAADQLLQSPEKNMDEQHIVSSSKESSEEEEEEEDSKCKQLPSSETPLPLSDEGTDDKQIEPPAADVHKANDAPDVGVPVLDETVVDEAQLPGPETSNLMEPVADAAVKSQVEDQPTLASAVNKAEEQPTLPSREKEQEENPKTLDLPESPAEAAEKIERTVEQLEVLAVKESDEVTEKAFKESDEVTEKGSKDDAEVEQLEVLAVKELDEVTEEGIKDAEATSTAEVETMAITVEPLANDAVKIEGEQQPTMESVVTEAKEQGQISSTQKGQEEHLKIVDVPKSQAEDTAKIEKAIEALEVADKSIKDSEATSTEVETTPNQVEAVANDATKNEAEQQPTMESVVTEAKEQGEIASTEKGQEETPKVVDVPESPVYGMEKTEEAIEPLGVLPIKESDEVTEKSIKDLEATSKEVETTPNLVEPEANAAKSEAEKKPTIVSAVKEAQEQQEITSTEKGQEENQKIVDVPESPAEGIEKTEEAMEPLEAPPVKESDEVMEGIKDSEAKSTEVATTKPADSEVEEKPEAKSESSEQVKTISAEVNEPKSVAPDVVVKPKENESAAVDPKGSLEDGAVKNEETSVDKVEDTSLLKEEETSKKEESGTTSRSLEQFVSDNQETQPELKKEVGGTSLRSNFVDKVVADEEEKKLSGANVVEELPETGQVGEETESKTLKAEYGIQETNVVTKELTQPMNVDNVNGSNSKTEATDREIEVDSAIKVVEGENTSKDVDYVARNKHEEDIKNEKPALSTNQDEVREDKLDQVTATVDEPVKESQEPESEVKDNENVEARVDDLVKEKSEKVADSDAQGPEIAAKDRDRKTESKDMPKELPAKPISKHSNNIISKVKQSLVKAKKAIIGKSPSSKTLSTETKGENKVK